MFESKEFAHDKLVEAYKTLERVRSGFTQLATDDDAFNCYQSLDKAMEDIAKAVGILICTE